MPTKPHRRLTIPVEILNREFDAKLLLACVAAERGFSVIIGFKRDIHLRMSSLPQSIYIGINLTARNLEMCDLLRTLGHSIACVDEEAIVYLSPDNYLMRRVSNQAFEKIDSLFAWGPNNARLWQEAPFYQGTPIHVTGHPRIDLLRSELRPFWSEAVGKIQQRLGRFILINSNFGKLNSYRPGKSEQLQTLQAAAVDPASVSAVDAGFAAHRYGLFQHFQTMLRELAQAHPDHTIVVRPHPAENQDTWLQAAAGCPNVQVIHEGHVVPWLLAAEVLIHNGCTTGVEAYLLDKPVIAYQPLTSESFDIPLPNTLSHQAFDLRLLHESVTAALEGGPCRDTGRATEQRTLAQQYFMALEGPFASERIVDVLEDLDNAPATCRRPPLGTYLAGKTTALQRRFKRQYKAFVRGDRNPIRYYRHKFHRHIFPEIGVSEVHSRITRFQSALNRFSGLHVRRLSKNIFEISTT